MIYELGDSVSIDEIAGVEYDPEPTEEMNNDNAEPVHNKTDTISETKLEAEADELRDNIISNVKLGVQE